MNKNIIAAAVLAASAGGASAQSAVTIYGIVDAGLVRESGGAAGTVNKLTSGVGSASRIGFRGTEDLGGGMSALFTLETGFRIDTGEVDAAGTIFNRQAFVGLKSKAGMLTLGRQYTPWHQALTQVGDPFGTGYAGSSKNQFPDSGTNVRTSNTIMYTAPVISGISADLAYSAGEQAGSNSAGRQFGGSIGYSSGPAERAPGVQQQEFGRGAGARRHRRSAAPSAPTRCWRPTTTSAWSRPTSRTASTRASTARRWATPTTRSAASRRRLRPTATKSCSACPRRSAPARCWRR